MAASLAVMMASMTPADAAPGVEGGFTKVTLTADSNTCVPEDPHCSSESFLDVATSGWAYNPRTVPSQQVYVSAEHDSNEHGSASIANRTRTDVQKRYHLSTAKVGFTDYWRDDLDSTVRGAVYRVCLHARDRGGREAWRTVQCVKAKVG